MNIDGRDFVMPIIITNGTYYVYYTDSGKTKKTTDIDSAYQFNGLDEAIKGMRKAKEKTKSYYVYDTVSQRILWKHMTQAELDEMRRAKMSLSMVRRDKSGKIIRKTYSEDTRKLVYLNANGRCELCGRKILLDDMSLDHIRPLSMGGEDDVENLACTCYSCNTLKGNILPDDFFERISLIYLYQMEKKYKSKLMWKFVHRLLNKIV